MKAPEKGLFDDVLRSGEVAYGYYQVTSPEVRGGGLTGQYMRTADGRT